MPSAYDSLNTDHAPRLLDRLPDVGEAGFGAALLRLAHAAAAQHRAEAAQEVEPWRGLELVEINTKDKAEHGSLAVSRSARDFPRESGPVTTEGDR